MEVVRFSDAAAFLERAVHWLMQAEVENNVILGLAGSIADGSRTLKEPPYFAAALDRGAVVACAARTPPHKLLVSRGTATALASLAADAFDAFGQLPGVNGPMEASAGFARAWARLTGAPGRVSMRLRIHAAVDVADDLPVCRGELREATAAERNLAVEWTAAFAREALPEPPSDPEGTIDRLMKARSLYFWVDRHPVTMCGSGGRTVNGARVGPVYTPREFRGRGHATAAVAELTRRLLGGAAYCCLYTDLANPTSNSIYRRIGYRPICDVDEYAFVR